MADIRYFNKHLRFAPFAFQCDECLNSSEIGDDINNVKCNEIENVSFSMRYGFQECKKCIKRSKSGK